MTRSLHGLSPTQIQNNRLSRPNVAYMADLIRLVRPRIEFYWRQLLLDPIFVQRTSRTMQLLFAENLALLIPPHASYPHHHANLQDRPYLATANTWGQDMEEAFAGYSLNSSEPPTVDAPRFTWFANSLDVNE